MIERRLAWGYIFTLTGAKTVVNEFFCATIFLFWGMERNVSLECFRKEHRVFPKHMCCNSLHNGILFVVLHSFGSIVANIRCSQTASVEFPYHSGMFSLSDCKYANILSVSLFPSAIQLAGGFPIEFDFPKCIYFRIQPPERALFSKKCRECNAAESVSCQLLLRISC